MPANISQVLGAPEDDVYRQLAELRRQIAELRTANTLTYSVVTQPLPVVGGLITVRDPDGNVVATIGTDENGTGVRYYRPDGSVMFESMGDNAAFGDLTYTAIHDRAGNVVFSDDLIDRGIGRPFIPLGPMVDACPPGEVQQPTTSTDWVAMQTAFCSRWHPRVMWQGIVSSSDPDTTGEVQLVDTDGNTVGTPITVPAGAVSYVGFTAPQSWPGSWSPGDSLYLTLQAHVTAGAGSVGVRTTGLLGWLAF